MTNDRKEQRWVEWEIRGRLKEVKKKAFLHVTHAHKHTLTVKKKKLKDQDSGITKKTYSYSIMVYGDLQTNTHMCTFHFHFALKPPSEHSFTVLMRQRIKQQTEGPLCSPSPPQPAPSLGVQTQHLGGRKENRDGRKEIKETPYVLYNRTRHTKKVCDEESFHSACVSFI